jgi:hypothetical protein
VSADTPTAIERTPEVVSRSTVALSTRTVTLYRQPVEEWDITAERYRAAVPELTSVDSWEQMFKCGEPPRCP